MSERPLRDSRNPVGHFPGPAQALGELRIQSPRQNILSIASTFQKIEGPLWQDPRLSQGITNGLLSLEAARWEIAKSEGQPRLISDAHVRSGFVKSTLAWNAFTVAEICIRSFLDDQERSSSLPLQQRKALELAQDFLLAAKGASTELQTVALQRRGNPNTSTLIEKLKQMEIFSSQIAILGAGKTASKSE